MASHNPTKPSFSPGRKWSIGFNVVLAVAVILAVVVMVNYLSAYYFTRFHVGARVHHELSPRTLSVLQALTNDVKVTLYYDKEEPLFSTVAELLNEYRLRSPRIVVETVDYLRDAGRAQQLKERYNLTSDKNLIIFDCEDKTKIVDGGTLAEYTLEQVPHETELAFRRKPTFFKGEQTFTAVLLDVTNPKPLKAYFLQGHGEHDPASGDETEGYLKFAGILQQNYIQVEPISLLGTNDLPMDCHLLIIAAPREQIPAVELEKIERYLNQGGRLLALFNFRSANRITGLEKILANWGVSVAAGVVKDSGNTITGSDVIVSNFGKHPVVNPLLQSRLHLVLPRMVGALPSSSQAAEAPKVEELAFTGPQAAIEGEPPREPRALPLMVAVEKGAVKGVITERGLTRMIVVGDSFFLGNRQIDSAANRDFVNLAANWLLDRTQLLHGVGPRPIMEYRVLMTRSQVNFVRWILLGAMPGAVLLVGGVVWVRRRS